MEEAIFWLAALIVLLFIEVLTLGLTTIWFAGGALTAFISAYLNADLWLQVALFLVVSLVLLFFTRPIAIKYVNQKRIKTNYEGLIGKIVKVSETVDNYNQAGSAIVNGVPWTVRSSNDDVIILPETKVKIVNITGVKLIVEEYREEM